MLFTLERVTQPEFEPVTLAEMKVHLREFESIDDMDGNIEALIVAGREWVEGFTGHALVDQTWRLTIEQTAQVEVNGLVRSNAIVGVYLPRAKSEIFLRRTPILSVDEVLTIDATGAETVVGAETYQLRLAASKYPKIVALNAGTWSAEVTQITFRAGYADRVASPQQDASVIPERFKQAIKLWVEANYDRDTDRMKLLLDTAECLIKGERIDLSLA